MEELLTITGAARQLGRSRQHVYDLIAAGLLPERRGGTKGNVPYLTASDLRTYIRSTQVSVPRDGAA